MADPDFNFGVMGMKVSGTEIGTILAGAMGSIITLRFLGPMPWYERLLLVIGGTLVTHYITPLAAHALSLQPFMQTIGFLVGLFGMAVIGAAFQVLSAIGANPLEWLRVVLSRPTKS